MRLVTFNIQHGREGLDRVGDALAALRPDLVCLQEVDRGVRRSGGVDQADRLAKRLGMHFVFAEALPFEAGSYGLAILAREELGPGRIVHLPHDGPRRDDGRGEPRALVTAEWRDLVVACTHLGLDAQERLNQARAIRQVLRDDPRVVLAGDLNEGPDGAVVEAWGGWFVDAFAEAGGEELVSGPPDRPKARIDAVLRARRTPRATRAFVGVEHASDHRPVIVDFEDTPA